MEDIIKTNENEMLGIQAPPQTADEADAGVVKPTNVESSSKKCPLRNTCKMPEDYCSKARCDDWFF
jgi:hypothetical protein